MLCEIKIEAARKQSILYQMSIDKKWFQLRNTAVTVCEICCRGGSIGGFSDRFKIFILDGS